MPYHIHQRCADIWELTGEWGKALETYRRLYGFIRDTGLPGQVAEQQINIGRIQYKMGDHEEAVAFLRLAEEASRGTNDLKQQASICNILGNIRLNQGRYREAAELIGRRLELNTICGDTAGLCATFGNWGNLEYAQGQLEKAEEWYLRQLATATELHIKEFQAVATGALGCIYAQREEYEKAHKSFTDFLGLARAMGDTGKIRVALGNIGNYYVQAGEFLKARNIYQQQLHLAERLGEKKGICLALGNMAKASHHLNEEQRALAEIVKAVEIGEKINLNYFLAEYYLLLGEIQLALKDLPGAEKASVSALNAARENNDPDDIKDAQQLQQKISEAKTGNSWR
jgi:tetratricopeptide (TPR) repeat protein